MTKHHTIDRAYIAEMPSDDHQQFLARVVLPEPECVQALARHTSEFAETYHGVTEGRIYCLRDRFGHAIKHTGPGEVFFGGTLPEVHMFVVAAQGRLRECEPVYDATPALPPREGR